MGEFPALVDEANRAFKTADHLAYVTYPIVTDRKLLMVIVENLHLALRKSMDAFLTYEYMYKRINHLPREFGSQLSMFRETAPRYKVPRNILATIAEINEIVEHREKSPIEFVRKDKFIIASENFRLKTVTIEKVKSYIQHIKHLLEKVNEVKALYDRRLG